MGELETQLHNSANDFWESIPYQTGLLKCTRYEYILKLGNNIGGNLTEMPSIGLEMQSRWEKQESTDGANAIVAKNNSGVNVLPLICLSFV